MGRGLRGGRGGTGGQRARCGAALALTLAAGLAAGAPQDPPAGEGSPVWLVELLAPIDADPQRSPLVEAWERGDGQAIARQAWALAGALREAGQVDQAILLLERVLERVATSAYHPLLAGLVGDLKRFRGRHEEAFAHFDQAEAWSEDPAQPLRSYARCYTQMFRGQALLDLGLLGPAQQAIDLAGARALELATELRGQGGPENAQVAAIVELGAQYKAEAIEIALGLHELAEERLRGVLAGELLVDAPEQAGRVRMLLGHALLQRARDAAAAGDGTGAGRLLDSAAQAYEAALEAGLTYEEELKARINQVDLFWLRGDDQRQQQALTAAYAEGAAELESAWRGDRAAYRARRLLTNRAGRDELEGALAELESTFADIQAEWLSVTRPLEGLGFLHWDEQRLVLGVWIQLLVRLHGQEQGGERALEVLARAQSLGTLTQRLASAAGQRAGDSWPTWRSALPEGAGALVFLPSQDSSFVLAVDAGDVTYAELPASWRELRRLIAPVARYVQRAPGSRTRAQAVEEAQALADALLPGPIRQHLSRWKSVTFVGAELLDDFGLEWLPLDGEPLGDRLATSYLPSLELGALLARRPSSNRFDPADLAVLVATGLPAPHELELGEDELEALRALGPDELRSGDAARLQGPFGAGVLAVVAHGAYLPQERRPAHLVLPGGPAGCAVLETAALPPVVCLLSCGAARGPRIRGDDGAVHLGGAALIGGASTVLLARNDIEAGASLALFELFLRELRAGAAPDEALRRARVALPGRRPEWSHPFYGASLRLFGLGRLPAAAAGPEPRQTR